MIDFVCFIFSSQIISYFLLLIIVEEEFICNKFQIIMSKCN